MWSRRPGDKRPARVSSRNRRALEADVRRLFAQRGFLNASPMACSTIPARPRGELRSRREVLGGRNFVKFRIGGRPTIFAGESRFEALGRVPAHVDRRAGAPNGARTWNWAARTGWPTSCTSHSISIGYFSSRRTPSSTANIDDVFAGREHVARYVMLREPDRRGCWEAGWGRAARIAHGAWRSDGSSSGLTRAPKSLAAWTGSGPASGSLARATSGR